MISLEEKLIQEESKSSTFDDSSWKSEFSKAFVSSYKLQKTGPKSMSIFDSLNREVLTISVNYEVKSKVPFFVLHLGEKYEDAYFSFLNKFESIYVSMPQTKVFLFLHKLSEKLKSHPKDTMGRIEELEKQWKEEQLSLWQEGIKVP